MFQVNRSDQTAADARPHLSFGSIVVDNPDELTRTIFEAVRATGVRALVSAGWSEVGGSDIPEGVFILGESRVPAYFFRSGLIAFGQVMYHMNGYLPKGESKQLCITEAQVRRLSG